LASLAKFAYLQTTFGKNSSIVLVCLLCKLINVESMTNNTVSAQSKKMQLNSAIAKGLDFLNKDQLHYGEFQSYKSFKKDFSEGCQVYKGSSPYITTFVVYSLSFIQLPLAKQITQNVLDFLEREVIAPGIWRFFTTNNKLFYVNGQFVKGQGGIVPDLDDTCCASFALQAKETTFNNQEIILNNRNENGLFYTWLLEDKWHKNNTKITVPPKNDICCGVNANVLLYLGANEQTLAVCQYLNQVVLSDREVECSIYFPDRIVIHYLISRAFFQGILALQPCRDSIVSKILAQQQNNGSFGDVLSTAFSICSLYNLGYVDSSIKRAINFLITHQTENGSWLKTGFFISTASYYGSEALTTGICLEALARSRDLFS
jgi:hypothetical protein